MCVKTFETFLNVVILVEEGVKKSSYVLNDSNVHDFAS